jgi:single-strand DNA-binding protein
MGSLNKAMVIGYLGADPDTRYMPSGEAVTTISVATTARWKDKASGEQKERTEWHRCVAFGKRAETMAEFLRKGAQVYVEGELQTRKWDDKDGVTRYSTEIRVFNFSFLDRKGTGDRPPHPADQDQEKDQDGMPPQSRTDADDAAPPGDFDDDIPF